MKIVSPQIYLQITARIQDHKNEKSVHIDEYLDNIIMDIGDLKERKLINKRAWSSSGPLQNENNNKIIK